MRSRDLLLSGADYDWITNYYTKWITGHEISRTDTRYTMYKTSWTTEWETTETVTVTKPGKTRVYIDISTTGGGAIGGIPDPIALHIANLYVWGYELPGGGRITYDAALRYAQGDTSALVAYTDIREESDPPDYGGRYEVHVECRKTINKAIAAGETSGDGIVTAAIMKAANARALSKACAFAKVSSAGAYFNQYSDSDSYFRWWVGESGGSTTTKEVTVKKSRQTQRETVRETIFKYYYWTYYQTSQSTSRVTKWYTDRYSDTKQTGVDPNQRYNGHLLSQTYYDRNDEATKEYGYVGESDHEKAPVLSTGAYTPKIGSIPNRQALDPNSNKWMESREDRQANQSNSKNLYSNNKNELLQTPSNKRNLQTYYVHNEPVS